MTTKTYKPQRWVRDMRDPELGAVTQYIEHTAEGKWFGWETYHEDGFVSNRVELTAKNMLIPLGYREETA